MSQPELLPIVEVCEESQRLQKQLETERWQFWGRIGTLTAEDIKRATKPDWQWDDYSI